MSGHVMSIYCFIWIHLCYFLVQFFVLMKQLCVDWNSFQFSSFIPKLLLLCNHLLLLKHHACVENRAVISYASSFENDNNINLILCITIAASPYLLSFQTLVCLSQARILIRSSKEGRLMCNIKNWVQLVPYKTLVSAHKQSPMQ